MRNTYDLYELSYVSHFSAIFCAACPETPESTSSNRIAVWPRDLTNMLFNASIIRDNSPPEAILFKLLKALLY